MIITKEVHTLGKIYEFTISIEAVDSLINDYGNAYGTVYKVRLVKGSGPPHLLLATARGEIENCHGPSGGVWQQREYYLNARW